MAGCGLLAAFGSTSLARAGCPNLCTIAVTVTGPEPALECLKVREIADDCDCAAGLLLQNGCTTPLDAIGFLFPSSCPLSGATTCERNTKTLAPNHWSIVKDPINELGTKSYELRLVQAGATYVITYQAEVTDFRDSGCSCSSPGKRAQHSFAMLSTLGIFGILGLSRVRAKRSRS